MTAILEETDHHDIRFCQFHSVSILSETYDKIRCVNLWAPTDAHSKSWGRRVVDPKCKNKSQTLILDDAKAILQSNLGIWKSPQSKPIHSIIFKNMSKFDNVYVICQCFIGEVFHLWDNRLIQLYKIFYSVRSDIKCTGKKNKSIGISSRRRSCRYIQHSCTLCH